MRIPWRSPRRLRSFCWAAGGRSVNMKVPFSINRSIRSSRTRASAQIGFHELLLGDGFLIAVRKERLESLVVGRDLFLGALGRGLIDGHDLAVRVALHIVAWIVSLQCSL